jgi:G:T-mismatch repair DNA endonuclease (very short patch repair protein)
MERPNTKRKINNEAGEPIDKIKTTSNLTKPCRNCNTTFTASHFNVVHCSENCRKEWSIQAAQKYKDREQEQKFKDKIEGFDYMICPECKTTVKEINRSHITKHGYTTTKEFLAKYNMKTGKCESLRENLRGENNPAYQHNGKYSAWSKNFVKYQNISEQEKEQKIHKSKNKAQQTLDDNCSRTTRLDYYTNRGATEQEAIELRSKRQTTFSLEICIEKYGEIEGRQKWEERQEKWLTTLDAKSDEEKARINELKAMGFLKSIKQGYSTVSFNLFEEIAETVPDLLYGRQETTIRLAKNKIARPDCLLKEKKRIIEFHGDYWHCNPTKFKETDTRKTKGKKPVSEIWAKDKLREQAIRDAGYDLLVIWENDYRVNANQTVEKCIEFLLKP